MQNVSFDKYKLTDVVTYLSSSKDERDSSNS